MVREHLPVEVRPESLDRVSGALALGNAERNSKYSEGEGNPPMYPHSRADIVHHAERIKEEVGTVFDPIGPFVVFSELIEGAAVIESQCISDTLDKRDRWVGCGTGRLDILRHYFGASD